MEQGSCESAEGMERGVEGKDDGRADLLSSACIYLSDSMVNRPAVCLVRADEQSHGCFRIPAALSFCSLVFARATRQPDSVD